MLDNFINNNDLTSVNVYVGSDGKIHFTNRSGADSALPFNKGVDSMSVPSYSMVSIFKTGTAYSTNLKFSKSVNIKVTGLTYSANTNAVIKVIVNGSVVQSGRSGSVNKTYNNVTSFAIAHTKSSDAYSDASVSSFTIEIV